MTEDDVKLLKKGDRIKKAGKDVIYTLNQFEVRDYIDEKKLLWSEDDAEDTIWDYSANISDIILVSKFKSFKNYLKQKSIGT